MGPVVWQETDVGQREGQVETLGVELVSWLAIVSLVSSLLLTRVDISDIRSFVQTKSFFLCP